MNCLAQVMVGERHPDPCPILPLCFNCRNPGHRAKDCQMPIASDDAEVPPEIPRTNNRNPRGRRETKRTPFPDPYILPMATKPRHLHTQEWLAQLN